MEQGIIIGSLQIGTTLTLIPGGILADRFGGARIVGKLLNFFKDKVGIQIPNS